MISKKYRSTGDSQFMNDELTASHNFPVVRFNHHEPLSCCSKNINHWTHTSCIVIHLSIKTINHWTINHVCVQNYYSLTLNSYIMYSNVVRQFSVTQSSQEGLFRHEGLVRSGRPRPLTTNWPVVVAIFLHTDLVGPKDSVPRTRNGNGTHLLKLNRFMWSNGIYWNSIDSCYWIIHLNVKQSIFWISINGTQIPGGDEAPRQVNLSPNLFRLRTASCFQVQPSAHWAEAFNEIGSQVGSQMIKIWERPNLESCCPAVAQRTSEVVEGQPPSDTILVKSVSAR